MFPRSFIEVGLKTKDKNISRDLACKGSTSYNILPSIKISCPKFCIFACYLFGLNIINETIPGFYVLALGIFIYNLA